MVVFEVDPLPWLPWGHQVIDGGPTRLPRTYYYATEDPLSQHHSYCIAVMDLAPPPLDEAHWRNQVLNFLTGPLNRNVLDHQPSLFGDGLYKLSSPNAVNALVNHGHFQVQNNFVRFLRADDAEQNHRASQGFRKGWLMMLGIHPDYRNDLDIANAVSTFGKFHSWNRDDPIKERVLVFASFPSPALVPRDVVFGKFATVGGVRESWTAPVFILSADFADVLPADEDPMPLDGNPHPLPGNLQPHPNLFVNPQYREIGWDVGPDQHFDSADGTTDSVGEQITADELADRVVVLPKERPVARSLDFDKPTDEFTSTVFSATPMTAKTKRGRKSKTLVVQPEECRFTLSYLKKDGHRPAPVLAVQPRPKKKARAKFLLVLPQDEEAEAEEATAQEEDDQEYINIPATPIAVMQRVGSELGIAPEKLTKEKLEADPASSPSTDAHDDD
ncbi:hypothetical protein ACQ4PT_042252 [Festuca glaucescens]